MEARASSPGRDRVRRDDLLAQRVRKEQAMEARAVSAHPVQESRNDARRLHTATTKKPAVAVNSRTGSISASAAVREEPQKGGQLALRVVKGLHRGALTPLTGSDTLLIGSDETCDVVLADEGVTGHHCLLTCQDGKFVVRAIDGVLTLNGRDHPSGAAVSLCAGAAVGLGAAAAFEVTTSAAAAELPLSVEDFPPGRPEPPGRHDRRARTSGRYHWGISVALAGLVTVACVLGAVAFGFGIWPTHKAANPVQAVAPAESRSGEAVAHDVVEVLRLSGIVCEGKYTSEGTVTVTGHFGDPRDLEAIIQSRAMREIVGLKRVLAANLDRPGESTPGMPVDSTRIVSSIASKDPYVITADGSRYYVGALLPQGGRLLGVKDGEVLVERGGQIERWKLPDALSGTDGFRPKVGQQR